MLKAMYISKVFFQAVIFHSVLLLCNSDNTLAKHLNPKPVSKLLHKPQPSSVCLYNACAKATVTSSSPAMALMWSGWVKAAAFIMQALPESRQ